MHEMGVSFVLSFVITTNLMPANLVQAYAEEAITKEDYVLFLFRRLYKMEKIMRIYTKFIDGCS